MSTQAQINANRENAEKSTGPKTEEGKAASSKNATRHGFYSKEFQVREDEREAFTRLYAGLLKEIQPTTVVLHELFLQYVHACWNLHRLRGIEADYFLQTANPFADETLSRQLETIARHRTRFERVKTSVFKQIQDQLTNQAIARESDNIPLSSSPLANLTVLHRAFKATDGEAAASFPSIDSILSGLGKKKQDQAA